MIDQETLKSVEDLHRLKTDGIITPDEFEKAKEKLLFGAQPKAKRSLPASALTARPAPPRPGLDDHLGWITMPLRRYADFGGRSSRTEFWMFQLAVVIFVIVSIVLINGGIISTEGGALSALFILLIGIGMLGLVVPMIAVQVRRLHDQDRPGYVVLLNLIPYIGALAVIAFMCMEGTKGDNQYGPDPWAD